MDAETGLKLKSAAEIEREFLSALEETPLPVNQMLDLLESCDEAADEMAAMMQAPLIESKNKGGLLRLFALRAGWRAGDVDFGKEIEKDLRKVFTDRASRPLLACAGFGEVGCAEATRRLSTLLALAPGVLVNDGTWGHGEVKRLDGFYKRITIDFVRKRGHQLSFAYAGETLEILPESHILAKMMRTPDAVRERVQNDAAVVVKETLESFGPLSLNRLEDVLADSVLEGKAWKSFWEQARKGLKDDPLVDLPAKRTEPIRLRTKAKAYDDEWAESVSEIRAPKKILACMTELKDAGTEGLSDAGLAMICERCAFAIRGTTGAPALMARLSMQAVSLGLDADAVNLEEARRLLEDHDALIKASADLPVKALRPLIDFLLDGSEDVAKGLVGLIPQMPSGLMNETLPQLLNSKWAALASERIRMQFASRSAPAPLVAWGCRNIDASVETGLVSMADLLMQALGVMETAEGGDTLKVRNQMAKLLGKPSWLKAALAFMSEEEARSVFERVKRMTGWDSSSKRSLMGHMVKIRPGLAEQLATASEGGSEQDVARFSSWRSLRERKEALKKMVEVDIPANSRDIAHARSYGDLRENFEYQAAKDQQRLLMRRKAELEQDLMQVKGSDFKDVPTDVVAPGTTVALLCEGGEERGYVVLGEWDRDEALAIVSSRSALAKTLMGQSVGERVELPGEFGTTTATVQSISPLDEKVREWIGVS